MGLIFNGKMLACNVLVSSWKSHKKEFTLKHPNHYARPVDENGKPIVDSLVFHWTGGEGGHDQIYKTLIKRQLGIHFTIDFAVTVHQYCDPAKVVCPHAAAINVRSIGVEIQNRGTPKNSNEKLLAKKFPRGSIQGELRGQKLLYTSFTSDQLDAALALADAFAEAGVIPRTTVHDPKDKSKPLFSTVPLHKRGKLKGVVGHFHVSSTKIDPGPQIFEELIDEGW